MLSHKVQNKVLNNSEAIIHSYKICHSLFSFKVAVYRFALELFSTLFKNFCDGIAAMIIDHTYNLVDKFSIGNQVLKDIINLNQLH